jgi:serine protease Do
MPEGPETASLGRGENEARQISPFDVVAGLKLAALSTAQRQRLHVPGNISGVVVTAVGADSPLAGLDLVPGDVIQTIDQQPVASPKDALAKIEAAAASPDKTVLMLINRQGASRYLALPLTSRGTSDGDG